MKLTPLFLLCASYASYSLAQESSISDTEIFTIQPITSIIPSSLISTPPSASATRTSTRIGGSQVEPSSFSTSRLTISDVSTDRPTPTTTNSGSITPTSSATSPAISSTAGSGTSAAPSPTPTNNAAIQSFSASSIGLLGALAAISVAILL